MNTAVGTNLALRTHGTKVDRIYRVLLTRAKGNLSWYSIAKYAEVSYGWAYTLLKDLEEKRIIKGHKVVKPRRMFEIWAKRPDTRIYREYHIQNPQRVLKRIKLDYALTDHFAENLINGYLFPRYFDIYILLENALAWHNYLSKNGFVAKGNVRVFLTDEHVFFERKQVDGWPIISVQQLIVDLLREGAECVEAADLLIKRFYHD